MLDATLTRNADAALTDEQQDFVRAIRDFAERELSGDKLAEYTDGHKEPHSMEIAKKVADLGWLGLCIDEAYGGSGGSFMDAALFLEETARGQIPLVGYGVTLIVVGAINKFGTEEQKKDLLGRVATGGSLAIAMSEPGSGSDVASLSCKARRDGDEYVITGAKMWISYAHMASHTLLVCRTTEGSQKHEGLSMIFVPKDAEGLTMRPIETLGGTDTNELHFEDVRVPVENLLGQEGNGWTQLMAGLNNERVILGAQALGLAQRAFDDALAYAKERQQFGKAIGTFQAIQHKFADMAMDLTKTRLLVRNVAKLTDEDPLRMLPQEASMVKLSATELAKKCALEGMQIMGGYGYASEYPMERYLRGAVVTTIFGGTSEIQKNIIAKTLGL